MQPTELAALLQRLLIGHNNSCSQSKRKSFLALLSWTAAAAASASGPQQDIKLWMASAYHTTGGGKAPSHWRWTPVVGGWYCTCPEDTSGEYKLYHVGNTKWQHQTVNTKPTAAVKLYYAAQPDHLAANL
jgi:hypothetical protein